MPRVSLRSRNFAYPGQCPCCGALAPTSELAIRLTPSERSPASDSARSLLFPYCEACVMHAAVWDTASATRSLVLAMGGLAAIVIGIAFAVRAGLLVLAGAVVVAVLAVSMIHSEARARRRPTCAAAGRAVAYHGWCGRTSTFAFASPAYAAAFAAANADKVVDAAPARPAVSPWIGDLDRQPSRIARRIALGRALDVVDDPATRRALADSVARAELAPFFTDVANLSRAARRERIARAIADVRADNLHDELRDAKLRELTSRDVEVG